jgi:hypothetical protein
MAVKEKAGLPVFVCLQAAGIGVPFAPASDKGRETHKAAPADPARAAGKKTRECYPESRNLSMKITLSDLKKIVCKYGIIGFQTGFVHVGATIPIPVAAAFVVTVSPPRRVAKVGNASARPATNDRNALRPDSGSKCTCPSFPVDSDCFTR